MSNTDEIDTAIAIAEAETGVRGGNRKIALCISKETKRGRVWTEDEEDFVRKNIGVISELEIAKHLGRTKQSIRIHIKREMKLTAMSKDPEIITAEQIANGIGRDSKSVHNLIDSGRMPGRKLPTNGRSMRVVSRALLMKWLLNPENWLYFDPLKVGRLTRGGKRSYGSNYDFAFWEEAGRIVSGARRKWKDQWMTLGQASKFLRMKVKANKRRSKDSVQDRFGGAKYVYKAIMKGQIKAKRWQNWMVKKSDLPGPGMTINYLGEIVERRRRS